MLNVLAFGFCVCECFFRLGGFGAVQDALQQIDDKPVKKQVVQRRCPV